MPRIRETCRAGVTILYREFQSPRRPGKRIPRLPREKPTSEAQLKVNARMKLWDCIRYMNHNFGPGDLYITFDYEKKNRPPTGIVLKGHGRKLKQALRKLYKKLGLELKYIYVVERGTKGALHHHIVINQGAAIRELRELWSYGRIHIDPLDDTGNYAKLANYFIKYSLKTRQSGEEGEKLMSRWFDHSDNLIMPETEREPLWRGKVTEEPRPKKGYYVDRDSIRFYITKENFPVLECIYVKDGAQPKPKGRKKRRPV